MVIEGLVLATDSACEELGYNFFQCYHEACLLDEIHGF